MARNWRTALPAALAACVAATAAAPATTAGAAEPVHCEVQAVHGTGGVQLRALARAARPVVGSYTFNVEKRGPGGTSTTGQSGEVRLAPGSEEVLGDVTIGLESGGTYMAELTVEWPGGSATCEKH